MNIRCRSPPPFPLLWKGGGMAYNYNKEYAKWKRWKEKEEELLKQHDASNKMITELRKYDWSQFNADRRYKRHQNVTNDIFFTISPQNFRKDFYTVDDILDSIEDEALYEYLKEEDPKLLSVILLKTQGYSIKEISEIIKLPVSTIYQKTAKIKKIFKNLRK